MAFLPNTGSLILLKPSKNILLVTKFVPHKTWRSIHTEIYGPDKDFFESYFVRNYYGLNGKYTEKYVYDYFGKGSQVHRINKNIIFIASLKGWDSIILATGWEVIKS